MHYSSGCGPDTCQVNERDHSWTRIELNFYRIFLRKCRNWIFFSLVELRNFCRYLFVATSDWQISSFSNAGLLVHISCFRAWKLVDSSHIFNARVVSLTRSFFPPHVAYCVSFKINSTPRGLRAEIFLFSARQSRKTRLEVKISKHVPGTRRHARST